MGVSVFARDAALRFQCVNVRQNDKRLTKPSCHNNALIYNIIMLKIYNALCAERIWGDEGAGRIFATVECPMLRFENI